MALAAQPLQSVMDGMWVSMSVHTSVCHSHLVAVPHAKRKTKKKSRDVAKR